MRDGPVTETTYRPHRSHSQLSNILHCGHQYYLSRVKRYPEEPSVWLAGGKAFHATTEKFDLETWTDTEVNMTWDAEPWMDQFSVDFMHELEQLSEIEPDQSRWRAAGRKTKDKPNGEDVEWWTVAGREMVEKYLKWRAANIRDLEIAAVKGGPGIECEVTLALGGVPMKGYVDRLFRSVHQGNLVVVDLKSGSRTPDTPLQLATYSLQLEPVIGEPVLWGAFYDARKGLMTDPISLDTWNEFNLGYIYKTLDELIERGLFLPNITSACKGCGVRKYCVYQGGAEKSPENF